MLFKTKDLPIALYEDHDVGIVSLVVNYQFLLDNKPIVVCILMKRFMNNQISYSLIICRLTERVNISEPG